MLKRNGEEASWHIELMHRWKKLDIIFSSVAINELRQIWENHFTYSQ